MKAKLSFARIVKEREGNFVVYPVWEGVDRESPCGYSCAKNEKLAARLAIAIESGKVWSGEPKVCTDVEGNTYVHAFLNVRMRVANADLKRLGF